MKLKVDALMKEEKDYEFPQFMRLLRKSLGFTRKGVAELLDVSESKMYYLEEGKFTRGPDPEFVATLAHFYGINGKFAIQKLHDYVEEKCRA